MKGILIGVLMVITSYGAQGQTMEKGLYNHKVNEWKGVEANPTTHSPIRPESIHFKGSKVILIFNRKDWDRMHERKFMPLPHNSFQPYHKERFRGPLNRDRMIREEVRKQVDSMRNEK